MNSVIKFVEKLNSQSDISQPLAQTGDVFLFLLLALIAAAAVALMFVFAKKHMNKNNISLNGNSAINLLFSSTVAKVVVVALIVLAVTFSILGVTKAFANSSSEMTMPDNITASVDKDSGAVVVDEATIVNNYSDTAVINGASLKLCDGITDNNCTWTINIDGQQVYSGLANQEFVISAMQFNSGESKTLKITTNMDASTAVSLIEKDVLSLNLKVSYTPVAKLSFTSNYSNLQNVFVSPGNDLYLSGISYYYVNDNNDLVIVNNNNTEYTEHANVNNTDEFYHFKAWSVYNVDIQKNYKYPVIADTTFVARYEKIPYSTANVVYEMNGHGKQLASNSARMCSKLDKPTDPVADGYIFAGWYKDSKFNEAWNFENDVLASETVTLYARWQVAISFVIDHPEFGKITKKDGPVLADAGSPYMVSDNSVLIGDGENMYWAFAEANDNCKFISWEDSSQPSSYPASLQTGTTFTAHFTKYDEAEFCLVANAESTNIELICVKSLETAVNDINLQYSTNGTDWTPLEMSASRPYKFILPTMNKNERIYLRGYNETISVSKDCYWAFVSDKDYYAEGNIMSLIIDPEKPTSSVIESPYCFYGMFDTFSDLHLESHLLSCPKLPAIDLSNYCYANMFANCDKLKSTCNLPASGLIPEGAYMNMFNKCINIDKTPCLNGATLSNYCYFGMFKDCHKLSLLTPSEVNSNYALPSIEIGSYAYAHMFENCTNLQSIPNLHFPYVESVNNHSDFYGYISDHSYSHMFAGCSALTKAPQIDCSDAQPYCFESMFEGCTSMKSASNLANLNINFSGEDWCRNSGLFLDEGSCYAMYKDCKSLSSPVMLPGIYFGDIPNSYCFGWNLSRWYERQGDCSGIAPKCCAHMYEGCESIEFALVTGSQYVGNSLIYSTASFLDYASSSSVDFYKVVNNTRLSFECLFKDCPNLNTIVMDNLNIARPNCPENMFKAFAPISKIQEDPSRGDIRPTLNWLDNAPEHSNKSIFFITTEDSVDYSECRDSSALPEGWEVTVISGWL